MKITRIFTFDAAHKLEWHGGKCKNLHGHTYKLEVTIEGKENENGVIIDFGDLKELVQRRILDLIDHSHLNDYLENPTAERLAKSIFSTLVAHSVEWNANQLHFYKIKLWETPECCVEVKQEDII